MAEYIWGRNPVLETLHSVRQVKRILLAEGLREAAALKAIVQEADSHRRCAACAPGPAQSGRSASGLRCAGCGASLC